MPQSLETGTNLNVGALSLSFLLDDEVFLFKPPNLCYAQFVLRNTAEANASAVSNNCTIHIIPVPDNRPSNSKILWKSKSFTFSRLPMGRCELKAENEKIPYSITIEDKFNSGTMFADPKSILQSYIYPLQSVDIVFFSNWLATFGDIILHAGGIALHEEGYAFLGNSGAGKSTLIENLARREGVTVLGEDQVILRWLDGKFWIFGTPWHERSEMCNPLGVPLEKLFILNRQADKVIEQANAVDLVKTIMSTAFIPFYRPEVLPKILERLDLLAKLIPSYYLKYELASDILPIVID